MLTSVGSWFCFRPLGFELNFFRSITRHKKCPIFLIANSEYLYVIIEKEQLLTEDLGHGLWTFTLWRTD